MSRALIVVALLTVAPVARAQLVDRVVAFVDDEVVLLSEVRERAEPELRMDPEADRLAVYRRVLGQMIDHELVQREARRLSVVVSSEEVASAIQRLQQQNGLDEHQWLRALDDQGWTAPLYEQVLREQILQMKVMQLSTFQRVDPVTDDDVRAEWERRSEAFERETRYRVAELTRTQPVGNGRNARDVARARMESDLARLRAGSATMADVGGTEVGWVRASEVPAETRDLLEGLEEGAFSDVHELPTGFTLLQLLERGETSLGPFETLAETIRSELVAERYRVATEEAMAELRAGAMIARRL